MVHIHITDVLSYLNIIYLKFFHFIYDVSKLFIMYSDMHIIYQYFKDDVVHKIFF